MKEKNNSQILGKILKKYRERTYPDMGLRRAEKEIGVDYTHIFRIENGQYIPNDETLSKLSDAYKLSPEEKFQIFTLARMTSVYKKVVSDKKLDNEEILKVLYRKNKK